MKKTLFLAAAALLALSATAAVAADHGPQTAPLASDATTATPVLSTPTLASLGGTGSGGRSITASARAPAAAEERSRTTEPATTPDRSRRPRGCTHVGNDVFCN